MSQKILITGASSAIGRELIKSLKSLDCSIIATYNSTKPTDELAGLQNCYWVKQDLANPVLSSEFISLLAEVNCFVHLAAVAEAAKVEHLQTKNLNRMFRINVVSAIEILSLIMPNILQQRYGRVIFLGSIVGDSGGIGLSAYSSTKSALEGLTKSINREFQSLKQPGMQLNVSVLTLRPGFTETPLTSSMKESIKIRIIKSSVLDRFLHPSEIALEIRSRLNDTSPIYSGAVIDINGGQTI